MFMYSFDSIFRCTYMNQLFTNKILFDFIVSEWNLQVKLFMHGTGLQLYVWNERKWEKMKNMYSAWSCRKLSIFLEGWGGLHAVSHESILLQTSHQFGEECFAAVVRFLGNLFVNDATERNVHWYWHWLKSYKSYRQRMVDLYYKWLIHIPESDVIGTKSN